MSPPSSNAARFKKPSITLRKGTINNLMFVGISTSQGSAASECSPVSFFIGRF
jgi:hypothetical protein